MLKFSSYCVTIVLATTVLSAAPLSQSTSTQFNITGTTKIPGLTLEPGPYSIRIVNRLTDRLIIRIDSADGSAHSTFIGITNRDIHKPAAPGIVTWSNPADGTAYLRGYYFSGTPAVTEFVYPKADAVAIANSNQMKVPAIDPASEGRIADPTLSPSDMQLVTLWLLSAERVSPSAPASIKAERYQQVGYTRPKPDINALPHTASPMPWVWMLSFWSLLTALILNTFRKLSPQQTIRIGKSNSKA
jgi:hypothetical protein